MISCLTHYVCLKRNSFLTLSASHPKLLFSKVLIFHFEGVIFDIWLLTLAASFWPSSSCSSSFLPYLFFLTLSSGKGSYLTLWSSNGPFLTLSIFRKLVLWGLVLEFWSLVLCHWSRFAWQNLESFSNKLTNWLKQPPLESYSSESYKKLPLLGFPAREFRLARKLWQAHRLIDGQMDRWINRQNILYLAPLGPLTWS